MAKTYRAPKYSTAQTAKMIRDTLYQQGAKGGLTGRELDAFVHASMGIAAGESSFVDSALNDGSAFGSNEYSIGPWQINMKAHGATVSPEMAMNPIDSTVWRAPQLLSVWKSMGGAKKFDADPVNFLREFHPKVQISITPSADTAGNSLQLANYYLEGGDTPYVPGEKSIAQPGRISGQSGTSPGYADPPPATAFDGLVGAILTRVAKASVSNDPDEQRAAGALLEQVPLLRDAFGQLDPTKAYDIAQTIGIRRDELDASVRNQNEQRRFEAEQNDLNRNAQKYGQDLSFTSASNQLAEDRRYHDQVYGISLGDLGIKSRQLDQEDAHFAQQMGISKDELDLRRHLGQSDIDIRNKQLGLQEQETFGNLEIGRGNLGVSQGRLALDTQTAQEANQLARETLDFNKQQSLISGARSDRQAAMSGLTDLLGTQVRAGEMSQGMATHALDALLQTWKEAPSTSGYLEGWEPSGVYSKALEMIGGRYEPSNYRVRPFPIDLQSLVNSGSKFDLSQAWQNAVSLMRGEGMLPQNMGGQSWPATSGTPGTAPAPTAASASPVSPTSAPPMTPTAPLPSAPPATVGAPMNSLPGAPSSTPPAQPQISPPAVPPATPPRTHWAWNGSTWAQVPDA